MHTFKRRVYNLLLALCLTACTATDEGEGAPTPDELPGSEQPAPEQASAPQTEPTEPPAPEPSDAPEVSEDAASTPQARIFGVGTSCSPNPCRNGGTCVDQWLGYSCRCAAGFSGTNCETRSGGSVPRCGDGIVSAGEECEVTLFTSPWQCVNCRRSNGMYSLCDAQGRCPNGLACHSAGYCTIPGCTNNAQCASTPPGPVISYCVTNFACTLRGCTTASQCPPGLNCYQGFCSTAQ